MKNDENRKKWMWITTYTLLVGFLMYLFIPISSTLNKYRAGREVLNSSIKELEEENENLKIEIRKLQSDSLYIEKMARKELGMIRPGEAIYRIEEEENYVPEPNR